MVFFADLMQDHEKVISHMLQNNQFEEAIRKLENVVSKCTVERYNSDWFVFIWYSFHSDCWKMCFEAQLTSCDYNFSFVFFLYTCVMLSLRLLFQAEPKLVYKFSPQLMQHVPSLTVDMWRILSTHDSTRAHTRPPLDPKRLIPSLVQYDVKPQQGQVSKQTIGLWIDPCNALQKYFLIFPILNFANCFFPQIILLQQPYMLWIFWIVNLIPFKSAKPTRLLRNWVQLLVYESQWMLFSDYIYFIEVLYITDTWGYKVFGVLYENAEE